VLALYVICSSNFLAHGGVVVLKSAGKLIQLIQLICVGGGQKEQKAELSTRG